MNENVIDPYGDFIESKYYLYKFGFIPSLLVLEVPLKTNEENFQIVLKEINHKSDNKVVIERWKISKYKDDKPTKDYINYCFL